MLKLSSIQKTDTVRSNNPSFSFHSFSSFIEVSLLFQGQLNIETQEAKGKETKDKA